MDEVIIQMEKLFVDAAVGSYTSPRTCDMIAERLIKMTERKIVLLNIRNNVVGAFNMLDEDKRKFLSYKFFKREDKEIDAIRNSREYFRKLTSALKAFSQSLLVKGFTEDKFLETCGAYPFIMQVYYSVKEQDQRRRRLPSKTYKVVGGEFSSKPENKSE